MVTVVACVESDFGICKNENLNIVEKMLKEVIDEVIEIGEIENKDVKIANNE